MHRRSRVGHGNLVRHHRAPHPTDLALKAASFAMPAWPVDGMDVLAVEAAAARAALTVRAGGGPCFLEFRTYRFRPHSAFDPELYRSKEEVEEWKKRDPIATFTARLRQQNLVNDGALAALEGEVAREIEQATAFADAGHLEPVQDLTRFVYSERRTE